MQRYHADRLADYICTIRYEDLPPEVVSRAKAAVLDNVGLAIGGADSPASRAVLAVVGKIGGAPEARTLRGGHRLPAHLAALANGTLCHSNDFTDTILKTVVHCGPVVVPAALAIGERQALDGRTTLLLVVLGYEIAGRIAAAINSKPAMVHHKKGFHATSTCGVFGAAAIAARALGLSGADTANALGHAASSASGVIESITGPVGADTFRTHPGKAAHDGILAALFAEQGLTGPHTIFEGRDGFLRAYSDADRYSAEALVDGLYTGFQIMDVAVKYHNGTHAIASAVDALQSITARQSIEAGGVESIEAYVPSMHAYIGGDDQATLYRPPSYSKAQMSLPFTLATALVHGEVFLSQYTQAALENPVTLEVAARVKVIADPEMDRMQNAGKWPARVRVRMKDGTVHEGSVEYPHGSPQRPLTPAELERKFRRLCDGKLDRRRQDGIIEVVDRMERVEDITVLTSLVAE
ncbi:MAG TPA: MmgE/PrpD family protein [Thermodesulfobacteriota bacterium]